MKAFAAAKYARQASAFLVCSVLFLRMECCSTPVTQYTEAQLLSPNYAEMLDGKTQFNLSKSRLCQGFAWQWDSVLVAKPYVSRSAVRDLPIDNYAAISSQVYGQSLGDGTCTLFFVKSGRYVAYGLVGTAFANIKKPETGPSMVWLTKSDVRRLSMKKESRLSAAETDTVRWYSVALASQK